MSTSHTASLVDVQKHYDAHRYLDAYRLTADYWNAETDLDRLSVEELILASRLALRLGGIRLSRWISRIACRRDPTHPLVRYYGVVRFEHSNLLERLRSYETQPDLNCDDPALQASWSTHQAYEWGSLRDFDRASACMARAHELSPHDAFVYSCEAAILGMADRWTEAHQCAERAWDLDPAAPYAAKALGVTLLHLGRVAESSSRLAALAEESQSFEVVGMATWHLCAHAETLDGDSRTSTLALARRIALRLESLSPLADRDTRAMVAFAHLDIANNEDDHRSMEVWAEQVRSPFFRKALENRRANPSGARIRLPFPRAIQKYDACLPTSATSALASMGVSIDPDLMMNQIAFGGIYEWAAAEWLERSGLVVRFFCLTTDLARTLIHAGIAFIILWESDDSGHAVAAIGIDESAGTLLAHDPRSFRITEYLLEYVGTMEAPLGPKAMAVVPAEKASLLDSLLPHDAAVVAETIAYRRAMALQGPEAAGKVLEALDARFPEHPGTRLLHVIQAATEDRAGEALLDARQLLQSFPYIPAVRSQLVNACRAVGNSALLRETLRSLVDTGVLPGMQSQETWRYPPPTYVCQYADLLRVSASTHREARSLLDGVLRRQPQSAEAWHNLGDLLSQEQDHESALLCYRLASCLVLNHSHYALAYHEALARAGRTEEGLAWLEMRARRFEDSSQGHSTWVNWIDALEDCGLPERALAACAEALEKTAHAPELLAFSVPFLSRMGHWEKAERYLQKLEGSNPAYFHQAAHQYHRMRGNLNEAIRHGDSWVVAAPQSIPARYALLDVIAARDGSDEAIQRARTWTLEQPGHDALEAVYCWQLRRIGSSSAELYRVLLRRVRWNPEDAWAWHQLFTAAVMDYSNADDRRRPRLERRIGKFLAQCERTAPDSSTTRRAQAEWQEARGAWREALDVWLRAIDTEPSEFVSYQHAWECATRFDARERERVWEHMHSRIRKLPGRLVFARGIMTLLAERFGVSYAEQIITQWQAERPEDPNVLEAAADLLIEHGHGRSDAERALANLLPAVKQFPYHTGLWPSLARAYRILGRNTEAEATLAEFTRRHPHDLNALIQLARAYEQHGDKAEAERLLDQSHAVAPKQAAVWIARCQYLMRTGRRNDAHALVCEGLGLMTKNVELREQAVDLLLECGDEKGAVDAAREGARVQPRGAYLWFLLGNTLARASRFAVPGEIEACFRRSLDLNAGLFYAADTLARFLVDQRRYAEAEQVMRTILARMVDPTPAKGRVAWIRRHEGKKQEAVEDLTSVVKQAPWYHWGWGVLMEWLAEDEAWEKSTDVLRVIPAPLRSSTSFRVQRLKLLEKAGLPIQKLNVEWDQLLKDFPEDVPLYLERHDGLLSAERPDEAARVLRQIQPVAPDNTYIMARLPAVLLQEQNQGDALDLAMRVWFKHEEDSYWPSGYVWETMAKAGLEERMIEGGFHRLEQGGTPAAAVLGIMARHILEKSSSPHDGRPKRNEKDIIRLLDFANADDSSTLLSLLCDYGHHSVVVDFWKTHPAVVNTDAEVMAQVARALMEKKKWGPARKLLATWPNRPGVKMYCVANYVLTLSREEDWKEIISASSAALAGLPHDHCAKYLAHMLAESSVQLADTPGFQTTWETFRGYFTGGLNEGEFFESGRENLLSTIPELGQALEAGSEERVVDVSRRIHRGAGMTSANVEKTRFPPRLMWFVYVGAVITFLRWITECSSNQYP